MALCGRIVCILLWLLVSGGAARAGTSTREQRAYETAVAAFSNGLWNVAEVEFAEFAQKYPASELVPQAGVLQAEAAIKQGKFGAAEALLTSLRPKAGRLAEDCTYWLGEAQFQSGDLQTAEVTLASVSTNSPLALQATVEAGAAMARLGQWPQLARLFHDDQDLFRAAEQADPDNEMALRGRLLLAQANFSQKQYATAASLLAGIKPSVLPSDLEWERVCLLCEVDLAVGRLDQALPLATNLVATARQLPDDSAAPGFAAAVVLEANVLEGLGRAPEAITIYAQNLSTNAPGERQRQAILKIAELSIQQHDYTNSELQLSDYVTRFTNAPARDAAWLALGELYLHDQAGRPGDTNLLASARACFDQVLTGFPNGPFAGKACLDRGWCGWLAGDYAACRLDFRAAVAKLPPSEDLAVAQFKLADTCFAQTNYPEALANYQAALQLTNDFPAIMPSLAARGLYQILRTQLQSTNLAGASATMGRIAAAYPEDELRESGVMLLGEGYTDLRQPGNALAVFTNFLAKVPQSPLRPAVELAIARADEEEQNWPAAVGQYGRWLAAYPTNSLLPQALYSRAWATSQAGDETNALCEFTNFVFQFPAHELAPMAQWWVAEHYFRLGDSAHAERNYKLIFENTNWQASPLFYPAQVMAGRAVILRTDNERAIRNYFEKLEVDTNCPLVLREQATFLHGSALMKMDSPDTNNPTKNFADAIPVFNQICQSFPTNETGARAWGMIGDCYLQLARYDQATNAYGQAMLYAGTNVAVQSQARIGLGVVLEKKAALLWPADTNQAALLLDQAEASYWDVLQGVNPGGAETPQSLLWAREAGLKAAELAEGRGQWAAAIKFYGELARLVPEEKDALARKIDAATQQLNLMGK